MKKSASKKAKRPQKKFRYYFLRYIITTTSTFFIVGIAILAQSIISNNVCANSISCIKDLSVRVENDAVGVFEGHKVIPPKIDLAQEKNLPVVLGATAESGPKHIYVDLTTQTLTAYQGNTLVLKTFISSGKWFPTPTGEYTIWVKLRSTRMSGGSGADYYNLPNVPYVMFFYNKDVDKSRGFSLHGAYWHNNFGNPMSHGCVNMRIVDAEALYRWVNPQTSDKNITYATKDDPGTPVTITGTPPIL